MIPLKDWVKNASSFISYIFMCHFPTFFDFCLKNVMQNNGWKINGKT